MARSAKLSKKRVGKHVYWHTTSGGKPVYFGNVKEVSRKDADRAFVDHRQDVLAKPSETIGGTVSVAVLIDEYLEWSKGVFSTANFSNKKSSLFRWANHKIGRGLPGFGQQVGDIAAVKISAQHLDDFVAARRRQPATAGRGTGNDPKTGEPRPVKPIGPNAIAGDMQHVKACFNWGRGRRLPKTFRPFADVARIKIPKRPKHESELVTALEIAALLDFADHDLEPIRGKNGRFRTRTVEECRNGTDNPYAGFGDMLKLYHGLGPRTSELATIQVEHVNLRKKQIVVRHKRERTMTDPVPRVLTLGDDEDELEIFKRHCADKGPEDFVFTQPGGQPWCQDRLDERFAKVRKLAKIRDSITLYSFRYLWISEAIEADMPVATIAEMTGTSIKQIESTYGHIRSAHRDDARKRLDDYRRQQAG